jgi:hypothetical protein
MKKSTRLLGSNPLTTDDVRELADSIALANLEATEAGRLLLLFYAFTYEQSRAERECMLQNVKEAFAFVFPAFDEMMSGVIGKSLRILRESQNGGEGR